MFGVIRNVFEILNNERKKNTKMFNIYAYRISDPFVCGGFQAVPEASVRVRMSFSHILNSRMT